MSAEQILVVKLYEVAEKIKGSSLSSDEKKSLLDTFNKESGSAFNRAKISIEKSIDKPIPESFPLFEKAYSSTNNLQNLLNELQTAAENWSNSQK